MVCKIDKDIEKFKLWNHLFKTSQDQQVVKLEANDCHMYACIEKILIF